METERDATGGESGTDSGTCTLCELPLSRTAVENEAGEQFCCEGCKQVKATLEDREDLSATASPEEITTALDEDDRETPDDYETTFLRVDGMHCATCETFIESQAVSNEDVASVDASYITDSVRVDHDPDTVDEEGLRELLTGLGYRAYARDDPLGERRAKDEVFMRLVVGVVFGMAIMMTYIALIYPMYFGGLWYQDQQAEFLAEMLSGTSATYPFLVLGLLTALVMFYTGGPILKGAYVSLVTRQPNMDLLVAVAAFSAWTYSTIAIFVESGIPSLYYDVTLTVVLVVTAGSYYENEIKQKANETLAGLTEAQVEEANRYESDGSTTTVSVDELEPDEEILVREGERVPVDGTVVDGEGTVDEAVVTGESIPVGKTAGDEVVGGSLLQDGSLVVDVGDGADSSIDRLTDMVWNLQSSNHGIQQLADRLATIFVPLVFILAVVVGTLHFALGASLSSTLLVALTVMIVSCPCALGLATPLAIASSVREALDRGIVVFDETIFERLQDVELVIFDKTGTLTTGEMQVLDTDGPAELFEQAALLETHSAHPVAEALAARFGPASKSVGDSADRERTSDGTVTDGGVAGRSEPGDSDQVATPEQAASRVTNFESYATGVGGTVDRTDILVGTVDLFTSRGWSVPDWIEERAAESRDAGHAPAVVGREGSAEGIAVVGDRPRDGWERVVEMLDSRGVEVAILTGDSEEATATFASHPGIDEVFAGVPPEAKAETVRQYGAGKQTVMVGDGTNDAPALATADLGIALGSGTALAADAADVAIVNDSLDSLETVFDLASAANSRVKQNIGWAFCYNAIAIPLAITGLINPLFAAVAMALSSLLVVSNSARELLE